jgi:hypothetical protein
MAADYAHWACRQKRCPKIGGGGSLDTLTSVAFPERIVDFVNDSFRGELVDEVNDCGRAMDRSAGISAQAAALRRFNRFYFGRMRFLREAMSGPGYRAAELRVLREIGESPQGTVAARIAGDLRMDPGRLSRILNFFRARGYLKDDRAAGDRRTLSVNGFWKRWPSSRRSCAGSADAPAICPSLGRGCG